MKVSKIFFLSLLVLLCLSACKKKKYEEAGLIKLEDFGDNKGNLKAYYYSPVGASSNMPLLVVLHGCGQTAYEYANLSDWNKLADEYGFYVLYPEQKGINNNANCFNWFLTSDNEKDKGENASIINMVTAMQTKFNLNTQQTYITGFSAGGAMSMVMISTYPESFQAAAIMSGLPYLSAYNELSYLNALRGDVDKTPQEWGDLVRNVNSNYAGDYPKICVFHGKQDNVVNFQNSTEIVEQWANVLSIDLQDRIESYPVSDIRQLDYFDANEEIWITKYEMENIKHSLALNPGDGVEEGGESGQYGTDASFFSSYWAAKFFHLIP